MPNDDRNPGNPDAVDAHRNIGERSEASVSYDEEYHPVILADDSGDPGILIHLSPSELMSMTSAEAIKMARQKFEAVHSHPPLFLEALRLDGSYEELDSRGGLIRSLIKAGLGVTLTMTEEGMTFCVLLPAKASIQAQPPVSPPPASTLPHRTSPFHRDAGLFSYTAGVLGAVAFMALAIGPGWLGFVVAFLPASAFAAWAVSDSA